MEILSSLHWFYYVEMSRRKTYFDYQHTKIILMIISDALVFTLSQVSGIFCVRGDCECAFSDSVFSIVFYFLFRLKSTVLYVHSVNTRLMRERERAVAIPIVAFLLHP